MRYRFAVVLVLTLGLLVSGLGAPAVGHEIAPPTVAERLDGLPAGEDASDAQERLEDLRGAEDGVEFRAGSARAQEMAGAGAVHSRRVRTPIPFSMVGFEIPAGADVGFRTSADGSDWSPWSWAPALEDADGPDPGSREAQAGAPAGSRSEGFWVGEARWLQVRVLNGRTEDVGIDLIDSLGLSRSLAQRAADAVRAAWRKPPRTAAAAPGQPEIVTREEWGADESLRTEEPHYASRARMGVVHHTATSNDYTREEAPGVVRAIYRYHTGSQDWSDIGYNLLIDRFGSVYEGRHGGLESAVIGAHARGWNTGTFGVAVMGCFDSQSCEGGGVPVPSAVEGALVEVLAWKLDVHSIDAEGTVTMNGTTKPALLGHREIGPTSCPSDRLAAKLGDIRDEVVELQDAQGGVVAAPGASPSAVELDDGRLAEEVVLSAHLRPAAPWQLVVTDPDERVVHTSSGSGSTASARWPGGNGLERGTYTYAFSSEGRRTATATFVVGDPCDTFCDLGDSVHAAAILRLHERGIVNGCAAERFCPDGRVTRGQMATMTARALELTPRDSGHFTDVPPDHTHADAINALYEEGIVQGDDGHFHPDRLVRRDQMATFLRNGLEFSASGTNHFSDVAGNVHRTAINALADHGVTQGDGSGRYLPERPIRRDQIASLIDRALQAAR